MKMNTRTLNVNLEGSGMRQKRFQEYLQQQKEEIDRYKWLESEKAGYDKGDEAVKDWIDKYAKKFRKEWEQKDVQKAKEELITLEKKLNGKLNGSDEIKELVSNIMEKLDEVEEMVEE